MKEPLHQSAQARRCPGLRSLSRLVPLLLLVAALGPVAAAAQSALYVGEVPVDAVDPERAPMLDALNQVLVRVTGRVGEDLVTELGLRADEAAELSLGRQYRRVQRPGDDGTIEDRRVLRVDFDPAGVAALLDRAGLPRWGEERPEILLWVVSEDVSESGYSVDDPIIEAAADHAAFVYGLPVILPILDASDRIEVTPADVRGGFTGTAVPAARRYGADGIAMLDLRRNGPFWTGRWTWRLGEGEQTFQRSGADRAEVVELGLARIAESLASRFAVVPGERHVRRVVVTGIDRAAEFAEVRGRLGRLTGVEQVRVVAASADRIEFELATTAEGLRRRIDLAGGLAFVRHDLASGTLVYRLDW